MGELIRLPVSGGRIKIIDKIGDSYVEFGVLLLQDDDGNKIRAIKEEQRGKVANINHEILRLWLSGKGRQPVTWATLVSVLQDIELVELAKDIAAVKMS
jgi:hypothetical protein